MQKKYSAKIGLLTTVEKKEYVPLTEGILGTFYTAAGTVVDINPILSTSTLGLRPGQADRVLIETESDNQYSLEVINHEPIFKNLKEGVRYYGLTLGGTDTAFEVGRSFKFQYIDPKNPTKKRQGKSSKIKSILTFDRRTKYSATKLSRLTDGEEPWNVAEKFDHDFALAEGQSSARIVLVGNGKREGLEFKMGGVELSRIIAPARGEVAADRFNQAYIETVSGNIYCILDTSRRDGTMQVYDVNFCRRKKELKSREVFARTIKGLVATIGKSLASKEFQTSEIQEVLLVKARHQLDSDRIRAMIESRNNLLERFSQEIAKGVKNGREFKSILERY